SAASEAGRLQRLVRRMRRAVVFEWPTLMRLVGDVDGKVRLRVATDPELRGELFRSLDARFGETTAKLLRFKRLPLPAVVVKVLIAIALSRQARARGLHEAVRWKHY